MPTKIFNNGRIKKADYDTASKQLDLHWDNKNILAYKQVPEEVYRRLCSAPNPTTYWEDRIAEEYPKGVPMTSRAESGGAQKFSDFFGGGDETGKS
jgi:KTSC domain